jgi:hypothetical protein
MIKSIIILFITLYSLSSVSASVIWQNGYGGTIEFKVVSSDEEDIETTRVAALNAVEVFVAQCDDRRKSAKCLKKVRKLLKKSKHVLVDDYVIPNNQSATGCISGIYKGKKSQKSIAWTKGRGSVVPEGARIVRTGKEMRKFCQSKYWEQWDFFWALDWSVYNNVMLHEYNHVFGKTIGHGSTTISKKLDKKYGPQLLDN